MRPRICIVKAFSLDTCLKAKRQAKEKCNLFLFLFPTHLDKIQELLEHQFRVSQAEGI